MLVIALFTALSALLIVATPLPVNHRPTAVDSYSRITLYRRAPPKFEIQFNQVGERHREDTIEKMKKHYETESTDEQKRAGLASVTGRWKKDLQPGREYMNFNYHTGDTTGSPVIPPMATIYRDKPAPKTHFPNMFIPNDHQEEMALETAKRYNDLHPDNAHRVGSMKVWCGWHLDGGTREKTQFTFHSGIIPSVKNIIGEPTTITRPLTLQFPELPSWYRASIDRQVHAAHRKMIADPQHPAATANYGTVHSNWHDSLPDANGETHKQVIVGLEEVSEKERKHLGNYVVRAGTGDYERTGSNAGGPSSHTAAGTSHAGPSRVNSKVARPLNSQEQRYDSSSESSRTLSLNSGSPHTLSSNSLSPHTLSPNSGSSHLTRQGSQFDVGGPSSRPGPSHHKSLYPGSPQQPLQPHTGNPPLHSEIYMPPESQPSHNIRQTLHALHPSLFSDPIWHVDSLHSQSPPLLNQIPSRPSSPSLRLGVGNPGPSQPILPQQSSQPHTGNQPVHNEFYMQWKPESHSSPGTWHTGLYSGQLSHTDLSHPKSSPANNQISQPPSPSPQVGPSPGPSESSHSDADLSPEIWHLLNPDPVYPYPWNPHLHNP